MKLVIASDIHGAADWCERLMAAIEAESPDRVILLGDLLYHGPRNDLPADYAPKRVIEMLNSIADQVIAVRGNCEAEVDQIVLSFPCMADHNVLIDPCRQQDPLLHPWPRLRPRPPQQRGQVARAARGLRAGLWPHAQEGPAGG